MPPTLSPRGAARLRALQVAVVLVFVVSGRAWAIPSPDLVVNLFASAAQVLGLVSVIFGSWFFGRRKRAAQTGGSARGWKLAFVTSTLLFVAAALGWTFFALHVADRESRRQHVNLERNSKEDGKTVGDVSLKELSFSEQIKRDDGIETAKLAELREQGRFKLVYDVREAEEYEVGRIAGVPHVRYPDLMKAPSKYLKRSDPTLLICFNGNRSSEMCHELREQGYDVYFIVGGYEKWIAEDRPLEMAHEHERTELRELPDYENKDVLLSTEEVFELMEEHDVLFVDVRYPGEFEGLGHLPGAVNLPARKLTTPELDAAIDALPHKPVIIPCYDRRSSFFASIVGLRLSRRGFEFLGRYPTPEGFWIPGKDKPHVAAWKKAQDEKTLLAGVEAPVVAGLGKTAAWTGGLALAIALLVLALRLVVLPLTLKSDRDRLVQTKLAPRIAELTARCKGDAHAISRVTMKLLRENGVRPFVNFAATVAQILLFTVTFGAVGTAAKGSLEPWAWVPQLGERDPWFVLPAAVGLLLAVMIVVTAAKRTRKRLVIALVCGLALGALVSGISAASNLYLTLNLVLLVAQTLLVRAWFDARGRRAAQPAVVDSTSAVVALRDADRVAGVGNKAARLAQLMRAGLPVPDGFVVSCRAIDEWRTSGRWSEADRAAITRAFDWLGSQRVAVRSSGLKEDGEAKSYAGVFESVLDVERNTLFEALTDVAKSLDSDRARSYADGAGERGAILVQRMVPADHAGVMFTEHPASSGACAIELVAGLGDALVSGRADPISVRLGRKSGRPLGGTRAPIDLTPLFELGQRVEALFGKPQDVEWAHAGGKFHLLQARDVTRRAIDGTSTSALRERERARLIALAHGAAPDEVVFAQTELSELLPQPTPYSLSWMSALWDHGGSADLACRELGIPYEVLPDAPPYVVSAFGATFVDPREGARRLPKAPGALASFRLSRAADELERAWREDHVPSFTRDARLRGALDLTQLTVKELVELHEETTQRILTETYFEAERINVAADFYFKTAVRALEKKGLDPARYLAHLPETVVHQAMSRLAAANSGAADVSGFLKLFGHRAPQDFELSQPRYSESPKVVRAMISRSTAAQRRDVADVPTVQGKVLALEIDRARRFQALKEEAKHVALRDFAFLRAVLLELGERVEARDDVFLLTHTEIPRLADPVFRQEVLPGLLRERAAMREAFEGVALGSTLTLHELETLDLEGRVVTAQASGRALRGLRVSGDGNVVGRARAMTSSDDIEHFREGEILVARFTDPTWTPVFPRARGIVTEVGGWLSHAAIQARECEVTAIVGVQGALAAIATGDLVALNVDGSVEKLSERRTEERVSVTASVELRRENEDLAARFGDVSRHGALVLVPGHSLELGEEIVLHCVHVARPLAATVVRNGRPGTYGVRFRAEIDDVVVDLQRRAERVVG